MHDAEGRLLKHVACMMQKHGFNYTLLSSVGGCDMCCSRPAASCNQAVGAHSQPGKRTPMQWVPHHTVTTQQHLSTCQRHPFVNNPSQCVLEQKVGQDHRLWHGMEGAAMAERRGGGEGGAPKYQEMRDVCKG